MVTVFAGFPEFYSLLSDTPGIARRITAKCDISRANWLIRGEKASVSGTLYAPVRAAGQAPPYRTMNPIERLRLWNRNCWMR